MMKMFETLQHLVFHYLLIIWRSLNFFCCMIWMNIVNSYSSSIMDLSWIILYVWRLYLKFWKVSKCNVLHFQGNKFKMNCNLIYQHTLTILSEAHALPTVLARNLLCVSIIKAFIKSCSTDSKNEVQHVKWCMKQSSLQKFPTEQIPC